MLIETLLSFEHYQVYHHPLILEETGRNNRANGSDREEDNKNPAIFLKEQTGMIHILQHFC